jgi:sigma-B regulation protein RsbU (phosphoserine phosphatase)
MSTILVIEDEKLIRESICDILDLNGYKILSESNGINGLKRAYITSPDLVLCDINMPKLNGLNVLKAIRQNEKLKNTPFVFLSSLSSMHDLRAGMNQGADDYLTKPFHYNELLTIISVQLKKSLQLKNIKREYSRKYIDNYRGKINEKTKGFFDSLNRAKTIQNVIFPSKQKMEELLPNHFNYFLPKYAISGDFYWARKIKGITLIAVADCTGHGIPGALISMACNISLNNAVDQFNLTKPAEILTKVNSIFLDFMNANQSNISQDGMDICLCAIEPNSKTVRFAGAKRPLYVITKKNKFKPIHISNSFSELIDKENVLYEIKGNNCSIGSKDPIFKIEEQVIEYNNGDTMYLSSDGYVDQFGGELDRKFKSKKLKKLLLSIQHKAMTDQKKLIAQDFQSWKGDKEQVDDATIIGIKL